MSCNDDEMMMMMMMMMMTTTMMMIMIMSFSDNVYLSDYFNTSNIYINTQVLYSINGLHLYKHNCNYLFCFTRIDAHTNITRSLRNNIICVLHSRFDAFDIHNKHSAVVCVFINRARSV